MAAPLAIGTRGTVGSLLRREIDYFKRLDLECASKRHQQQAANSKTTTATSTNTCARSLSMMNWMKKKKRRSSNNGGSFLPSMCSAVDVSEGNTFNRIPGFSYRTLKPDMELDL